MAKNDALTMLEDKHFEVLIGLEKVIRTLIKKTDKEIPLKGIRTTDLMRITKIRYDKEENLTMLTTIEGKEYELDNLEFDGFMFIEMAKQIQATLN